MPKKVNKKEKVQKPFDFSLCITIFLLLALGIVMVLSASAPSSLSTTGNSYTYVTKQLIFALIGIVLMLIISKIDYKQYKRFYKIAYIISIIALASVIVPGIGKSVNGAKRWIDLGFGTFQPSEIAKVGLIIFYAGYLTEHRNEISSLKGFIKSFAYLVPPIAILFFLQDHLSASIVIILIVAIMNIMAGIKMKHFIGLGAIGGAAAAAGMWFLATFKEKGSFRLARITSFLDPFADVSGDGWQVVQGLYAIGSGGLFGVGLRRK